LKIVLSRKGFDSTYGRVPSPILPNGRMLSLPIPGTEEAAKITYDELSVGDYTLGRVVRDLTRDERFGSCQVHLDPDLRSELLEREPGWRAMFGQDDAAQRHLERQGVGVGDLFLLFGWSRQTELRDGRLSYVKGSPNIHVLFGWLQVGEVLKVNADGSNVPSWGRRHPHATSAIHPHNTLYIAREELSLAGSAHDVPGAGVFPVFRPELCLTAPGQAKRSRWRLPAWFHPSEGRRPLTYHGNLSRWSKADGWAYINTVGRGQEFVLHTDDYPEALDWARELIGS